MELETEGLETMPEESVPESLTDDAEPETVGSEPVETAAETLTGPETVPEDFETEGALEEEPETEQETIGSPVSVSSNTITFPEGYGYITAEYGVENSETVIAALDAQKEAVETQTEVMKEGFAAVSSLLGIVIGILLMHGFRFRRV